MALAQQPDHDGDEGEDPPVRGVVRLMTEEPMVVDRDPDGVAVWLRRQARWLPLAVLVLGAAVLLARRRG